MKKEEKKLTKKEYTKLRKWAIKELEEWLKFIIDLDDKYEKENKKGTTEESSQVGKRIKK